MDAAVDALKHSLHTAIIRTWAYRPHVLLHGASAVKAIEEARKKVAIPVVEWHTTRDQCPVVDVNSVVIVTIDPAELWHGPATDLINLLIENKHALVWAVTDDPKGLSKLYHGAIINRFRTVVSVG